MRYLLLLLFPFTCAFGQNKDNARYTDARSLMIIGKGVPTNPVYVRLDTTQTKPFPQSVRYLSTHSAGIAVLFETNSPYVRAKWGLRGKKYYANMTPIVHSGLDLYAHNNGKWQWVAVGRPLDKDTINTQALVENMDNSTKQFMLYLPTYNELTSLEIGVAPEATLAAPERPAIDTNRRVVIYGSSILQGASASRAGMTYPGIISRRTGWEVINLGFSGAGKMEFPVAELLATMKASCFVLDCIPNPSPAEIKERAYPFIKHLLTKRPEVPVLLVESRIHETGYFDSRIGAVTTEKNNLIKEVYTRLKQEGFKQLYYLPATNLTGHDHEGTIDGSHLTDLGFMRQADEVQPLLEKLMKKSGAGR